MILVLTVVGYLSFHAVGNLVAVNREIATRTIPAVRLAASTREAITPLVRLETRALVLGDLGYAAAWNERAERVAEDLKRLAAELSRRGVRDATIVYFGGDDVYVRTADAATKAIRDEKAWLAAQPTPRVSPPASASRWS